MSPNSVWVDVEATKLRTSNLGYVPTVQTFSTHNHGAQIHKVDYWNRNLVIVRVSLIATGVGSVAGSGRSSTQSFVITSFRRTTSSFRDRGARSSLFVVPFRFGSATFGYVNSGFYVRWCTFSQLGLLFSYPIRPMLIHRSSNLLLLLHVLSSSPGLVVLFRSIWLPLVASLRVGIRFWTPSRI